MTLPLHPVPDLGKQAPGGRRLHQWTCLAALLALLAACSTPPPLKQARPIPPASAPQPGPEPQPVVVLKPLPPIAPSPAPAPVPAPAPAPTPTPLPALVPAPALEPPLVTPALRNATATTARDYRRYGASHIYAKNKGRVFKGKLPPMLYAVGVLNVDLDNRGQVQRLDWMRAPKHAPEVMADIERMVRAAAPFPAPARMGRVTWTDVWLWDKSGRFQLDTLTEGQRSR